MKRLLASTGVMGLVFAFGGCGEGTVVEGVAGSHLASTSEDAITGRICPAASGVQGVDVSVYQGSINWAAVKSSGVAFAIARIGDGTYKDTTFETNWNGIKDAGLIRGSYQFFEPGEDPNVQANIVISKVGRLGAGDLPVMLDVEVTGGQSPATITAHIHQWVDAVTAGTGKQPFIYTGAYFWDGNVKSPDFGSLALDVAWYGTNCPGIPSEWSNWTFHQFTSSGRVAGISGDVDVNLFNGSLAELQAFAGASGGAGDVNPDLFFIDRDQTGSGGTEVHALSAASAFQEFSVHSATGLSETGTGEDWQFLVGDYNRDGVKDIYVIKKQGGSGKTEVHVLDGASGFQRFSLHIATPLEDSGTDGTYQFALGDYDRDGVADLYVIKRDNTGSDSTEVHILSGADGFQTWLLHTGSALGRTGSGAGWKFLVGDYDGDGVPDLYAVSKAATGTHSTEVHVLSGADHYGSWLLHTGTALQETGADHSWDFGLADFNGDGKADLYAIAKMNTGTQSTEVHILSGADDFKTWLLHTGTGLATTGNDLGWELGL
jgi:GH25 family lysozyme M1 (1,4-beta-N-acetylmuramidase)